MNDTEFYEEAKIDIVDSNKTNGARPSGPLKTLTHCQVVFVSPNYKLNAFNQTL